MAAIASTCCRTGRRTLNKAPQRSPDVTEIDPPWLSTMVRLIESPTPIPSAFVVWKAVKRLLAIFGSIPVPVSSTSRTASCEFEILR